MILSEHSIKLNPTEAQFVASGTRWVNGPLAHMHTCPHRCGRLRAV
jgi:hypothetical protein